MGVAMVPEAIFKKLEPMHRVPVTHHRNFPFDLVYEQTRDSGGTGTIRSRLYAKRDLWMSC